MTPQAVAGYLRSIVTTVLFLAVVVSSGCQAQPPGPPKEPMIGVAITGIDHLADHLSVQQFSLNGYNAAQAGKGGSSVCCAMLPAQWRPDMRVLVEWVEQNWRDCSYRRRQRGASVAPYEEAGRLWVHFLADDSMRLVVSNVGPGNPEYPGPDDPIPRKFPMARLASGFALQPAMGRKRRRTMSNSEGSGYGVSGSRLD